MTAENAIVGRSSDRLLKRWGGLLAAVISAAVVAGTLGGAFFVRAALYDVDKTAQQAVNARVDTAQAVVTVKLEALQKQVETNRTEQAQQNQVLSGKLDQLIARRR